MYEEEKNDVEEGKEDKGEYIGKGKNKAEIDKDSLHMTQLIRKLMVVKGVLGCKKTIPVYFDISPYPLFGYFFI